MKRVCFTGHRRLNITPEFENKLNKTIMELIENGALEYYAGGARGFDMLAAMTVLKLRESYPQLKLNLVLPCSNEEQTLKWTDEEKIQLNRLIESADNIEYTSEHYSKDCMKIRNKKLVEAADCCVCYYSGRYRSGTGQTVRLAENKGITVYNLFEN